MVSCFPIGTYGPCTLRLGRKFELKPRSVTHCTDLELEGKLLNFFINTFIWTFYIFYRQSKRNSACFRI